MATLLGFTGRADRPAEERRARGDGLVAAREPRSVAAEAYRTLRTNIQFSSLDRDLHTLLVTSPSLGDGKSTVLANLAITMAEAGRRVIAVDCDLRRPGLHDLFGVRESPGLTSTILEGDGDPPLQATAVPNLCVLSCGPLPPNPAELMASERMGGLIARLAAEADVVLIDSPPLGAVSDAAALAARVDGVLLVVSSGQTRRDAAQHAKEQVERVGGRLLGVVLNNVKAERNPYRR